jgi:hypothetical protein
MHRISVLTLLFTQLKEDDRNSKIWSYPTSAPARLREVGVSGEQESEETQTNQVSYEFRWETK